MKQISRRFVLATVAVLAVAGLVATSLATALAAGNPVLYRISLSFSCENKALCVASPTNPFGIGGGAGTIALVAGGSGSIQFEGRGHSNALAELNQTVHISGGVIWTFTPDGQSFVITILDFPPPNNVLVLPSSSGHHELAPDGPGQNNEVQVIELQ